MEDVLGLIYTAGIYVGTPLFIGTMVWLQRRRKRQLEAGTLLEPLAVELRADVARDPSTPMPFVRLELRGLRAYLSLWPFGSTSRRVISLLEIRAGCEAFLEATSRAGRRHPSLTTRITQIDTPANYVIMTSQPRWAWTLEKAGIFDLLGELEKELRLPLRLQLTASRVTLEAEGLLDGPGARALLDVAGRLVERLNLAPTTKGVDILQSTLEPGRCPVCGVKAEPPVACSACQTPHHADCWAYLGRCGIFGCPGQVTKQTV